MLGFGFIFISGFALLPAMLVAAITEAFHIRGALTYAVGGALVGLACYLGLVPFDTETLAFRRHRPASSRNHDRRRYRRRPDLLDDRGPQCRRLARAAAPPAAAAAAAVAFTVAGAVIAMPSFRGDATGPREVRPDDRLRIDQMCNCTSGISEIPGSRFVRPGMTRGFHERSPRLNPAP